MVALAAALSIAVPVLAHGLIERAEPPAGGAVAQSPAQVQVWFTEPIEPRFSALEVFPAGSIVRIDLGDSRIESDNSLVVSLPPDLPRGAYTVAWRVVTLGDGHETSGAYSFGVGVPAEVGQTSAAGGSPLDDAFRFLSLAGQSLFVGVAAFRWAIRLNDEDRFRRALFWVAHGARAALVVGLIGALFGHLRAVDAPALDVLRTQWGVLWLARAALVGAIAIWVGPLLRGADTRPALAVGGLLLLTTSFASHSAAKFGLAGAAFDWFHLLAAAVWSGGVLCAAIAVAQGEREFLANFSNLATAAVGAVVASGVWLGVGQVGSWAGLLLTPYGRALLIKLAVVALAFGLGAVNAGIAATSRSYASRSHVLIGIEVVLGLLVILSAAALTNLPPAVSQTTDGAPTRVGLSKTAGNLEAALALFPARAGANTFEAKLTDAAGKPVVYAGVSLQFHPLTAEAVVSELRLTDIGDGLYSASGVNLTAEGDWEVLLAVNTREYANFDYSIGPDGAVRAAGESLPMAARVVGWLNRYAMAWAAGAFLASAAGWSWLAWRGLPRARWSAALWLAPGLVIAGAIWFWIALNF